jgi:hypothetical protein
MQDRVGGVATHSAETPTIQARQSGASCAAQREPQPGVAHLGGHTLGPRESWQPSKKASQVAISSRHLARMPPV